ncbi:MAG: hypothetical protein LBR69_07655 [Endomicrobium sp.]|jgi:CRISPR-associated protein Csm4|nr:hypothetical protein [Endomicrobium sp.]
MKIYEILIKPKSAFVSQLKGDMLFGALCCQIENLSDLLKDYYTNPFMVVSSAFYKKDKKYIFPSPACPNHLIFPKQSFEDRRTNDEKKYFSYAEGNCLQINDLQFPDKKDEAKKEIYVCATNIAHNTINRLTQTTGGGEFAPFSTESVFYSDETELVIFAAIDEPRFDKENLEAAFKNLGILGYGKKASSGYGHFEVESIEESPIFKQKFSGCNYLYALSPFIPSEKDELKYFQPFTRYGKHGGELAVSKKPFKRPVIFADEAALLVIPEICNWESAVSQFIIGKAIKGVSDILPDTVVQGYSLCLPCRLEE